MPDFMDPWFFLLLTAVPLWLWGRRTFLKPASFDFSESDTTIRVSRRARARFLFVPVLLQAAGLSLVVIALARPVMQEHDAILYTEGVDIMLCVDISSSMSEHALAADRTNLDVARDALERFVASRKDDRLGLVVFARFPELRCPLTTDHEALSGFLERLSLVGPDSEKDGTAVGAALAEAAKRMVFSESGSEPEALKRMMHPESRSGSNVEGGLAGRTMRDADTDQEWPTSSVRASERERIVVLLTDGEENQHLIEPWIAANLCADLGIRVYPIFAASLMGKEVRALSKAPSSEQRLRAVARITSGVFARADTEEDLERIYQEIDALEKRPIELKNFTRTEDLYPWFLVPAMALLLLAYALDSTILLRIP